MATQPKTQITVSEILELLEATATGNKDVTITGAEILERASESDLAYVGCSKQFKRIEGTRARVIVAPDSAANALKAQTDKTFIFVAEPEASFLRVVETLVPVKVQKSREISPLASVAKTASIGRNTSVEPYAVIGENAVIGEDCQIGAGVSIGDDCVLGDNVIVDANCVLYPDVVVGNDVVIHATTVIGATGFGYQTRNGRHELLPHFGNVVIEDDVEIGAGTTIDRAKVGSTVIGTGTRIDNCVMIGHNCRIGKHNLLVSQTGIAGSSSTGDYVVCAGQAGIADHVHLDDGVIIGAQAGVHRDMPGGKSYMGSPARPITDHAKETMSLKRLPEIRMTVKDLKSQVSELQEQIAKLLAAADGDTTARDSAESRDAA